MVLAGSLLAHVALLGVLALPQAPVFLDRSNDEGAIRVTLERLSQDPGPASLSSPLASLAVAEDAPTVQPRAPRLTPPASVTPLGLGAVDGKAVARHPAPLPEGPRGDLRSALRGSGVGCANVRAVGLNRREIERCHERWGEAARKAPDYANAPLSAGATQEFRRQALRQEAYQAYRASPMGPGVDHRSRDGLGKAKDIPFVGGLEQNGEGRERGERAQELYLLNKAKEVEGNRAKAKRESEQR